MGFVGIPPYLARYTCPLKQRCSPRHDHKSTSWNTMALQLRNGHPIICLKSAMHALAASLGKRSTHGCSPHRQLEWWEDLAELGFQSHMQASAPGSVSWLASKEHLPHQRQASMDQRLECFDKQRGEATHCKHEPVFANKASN